MITEEKINTEELLAITDDKAGAIVTFFGAVRNHNLGEGVNYLEYEAYVPMGNKMITKILAEAKERWGLHKAACIHRIGRVAIGELAVAVITLASHRKEAYEANEYIINTVKAEVPIWKKEYFSDGKITWSDNDNKETKTL